MPLWTPSTTVAQPTIPAAPGGLTNFQFQINGPNGSLTIGPGTAYTIQNITGLGDLPTLRTGDVDRPRQSGEFMGYDFSTGRDVSIELWISAAYSGGSDIQTIVETLANVTVPSPLAEYPLWFQLPHWGTELALVCRPRKRIIPYDVDYANNQVVAKARLEFHATDPRVYAPDSPTTINFSGSTGALVYPITNPLTYTGVTVNGSITNSGTFGVDCLIKLTNAVSQPFVANTNTNQAIGFWIPTGGTGALAAGDVAWIDTYAKSIIYWASGATSGTIIRSWMEPGSQWFGITNGGATTIKIGGTSASAATAVVHAPSGYFL